MKLSEDLAWRGLIKDKTFTDAAWLDKPKIFYHGVDASASSMTIGNLAAMLMARRLIDAGWQAVLLAGGATSLIGDPKETEERDLKSREEIEKNVEAVKTQINQLFAGKLFTLVDNHDWFKDVSYLDFLREVGKNFAMSELMQREFITDRLNSGISYAEFSYSLIQGYDYWQLYKKHDVVLQIGGSDQWGNMLSGVSLVRKKEANEVHALSMPLVVDKATGRKFGKSEAGAVWLDPVQTSPTQFYQFWINAPDEDVEQYLKVFTLLPKEKIIGLMATHKKDAQARVAQKALAEAVTELVHGREHTHTAAVVTDVLTGKTSIANVGKGIVDQVAKEIVHETFKKKVSVLVATAATLASSNTEAKRLIASGAIRLNGQKVTDENQIIDKTSLLRRGKAYKDSALVELS